MPQQNPQRAPAAQLRIAYPQLFVTDMARATAFYSGQLDFTIVYLYGEPPFYGLVARDGIGLNLRHLDAPPIDPALRTRESLLSAVIVVDAVEALFAEFAARGVTFAQPLARQPWGTTDFIVRDPDGNLVNFASPASA